MHQYINSGNVSDPRGSAARLALDLFNSLANDPRAARHGVRVRRRSTCSSPRQRLLATDRLRGLARAGAAPSTCYGSGRGIGCAALLAEVFAQRYGKVTVGKAVVLVRGTRLQAA